MLEQIEISWKHCPSAHAFDETYLEYACSDYAW